MMCVCHIIIKGYLLTYLLRRHDDYFKIAE